MANILTLAIFKTRVRNKLDDSSFSDSKLTQFADDVNKDIFNSYIWPFCEKTFVGTVTTTTSTYDFPSDHQATIDMTLIDPNATASFLTYVPYKQFDTSYPDPAQLTSATPTLWTRFGSSFIVGPSKPNATYTLSMRYLKDPATISSDANTFDVPDSFAELIVLGMYRRALESEDEWDLAQPV